MDQQNNDVRPALNPVVTGNPPDDVEENKDMAALSYAWILSLVVFVTRRNSPFVRFHAKQGIILFILSIVFWMIPYVGRLLELVVLAFCAFGFIAAAQGQWKDLPFIGAMARGDWKTLRNTWKSFVHSIVDAWHHFRAPKQQPAPTAEPQPSSPPKTEPLPATSSPAPVVPQAPVPPAPSDPTPPASVSQ